MFTCTCVTYTYRTLIETEIWDFYILSVYSGSVTKYLLEYEKKIMVVFMSEEKR